MRFILAVFFCLFSFNALAGFGQIYTDEGVDLVFIIDDSGSMMEFQTSLSHNVRHLLGDFRGTNLHIGVLSTSRNAQNKFGVFAGSEVSGTYDEVMKAYEKDILLGNDGYHEEQMFRPLVDSFTAPENAGFYRKNAKLVVVVVSDTDDQGSLNDLDFLTELTKYKPLNKIQINGILATDTKSGKSCPGEGTFSGVLTKKVESVVGITKGELFSICEIDWSGFKIRYLQ